MENQKILNTPTLLAALVEVLNLQQMEISELLHEGRKEEAQEMKENRRILLKKANKIAIEIISTQGIPIPTNVKKLPQSNTNHKEVIKEHLSKISKPSKVIIEKKFNDKSEKISAEKRSYSKIYEADQVKNRMSIFSTKKNLSPEDLLKNDEKTTPLSRLVRKSISHMLQLGKRLEAVDYLTKYIFKYLGFTPDEAHKLINEMKDKFGIIEISKLRPVNKKRTLPKGKIIFAEFNSFKNKSDKTITGYIIWPEDSKNNSIFDFIQDEFVCMSDNVIKFREVSPLEEEEIQKKRDVFINKVIEKTKKQLEKNK